MKFYLACAAWLFALPALSQSRLIVLRAGRPAIDVREGGHYHKAWWYASPAVKKDIYYTQRFRGSEKLTFITDQDSLRLTIAPGRRYRFIILLNKDSCLTEVNTTRKDPQRGTDAIPFTIGRDDRIYLAARLNGSVPLRLFFDTGADNTVIFPSALQKGLKLNFDDSIQNTATGGTAMRRLSNFNTLQLEKISWQNEPVMAIGKQLGDRADGTVGADLFTNKMIEIDFDRLLLVIYDRPFVPGPAYQCFPMQLNGATVPVLPVTLHINAEQFTRPYIVDMGATGCLFVGRKYAEKHALYGKMKSLGETSRSGGGDAVTSTQLVQLPSLQIGPFTLMNVPINLQGSGQNDDGYELGMNLLKRFDVILDYRHQLIYLKPDRLFSMPYK